MAERSAPVLNGMSYQIWDDGNGVFITLRIADQEETEFALSGDGFSQFVTAILGIARETAQKTAPANQKTITVNQEPLPVAQIGVGKGRSDTEAILSIHFGLLKLLFVTEPSTLLGMCKMLQAIPWEKGSQKPQ